MAAVEDASSSSFTQSPATLSASVSLSVEQLAVSYLFNTFIICTPFDGYLPSFCRPYTAPDDACAWAIDATALAAYGRHSRSRSCQAAARAKYAGALTRVNSALTDPAAAIQDRTLVAVLVLALFEATVFQGGLRAPTSWAAHTYGAMQLLMLRGLAQFSRPTARLLFAHASSNVKASCIQRSIAVPQPFLSFDTKVRALLDQLDPAVKLTDLLHKVGAIKEMSQNPNPTVELVLEAIKVDQELIVFSDTPPPTLEYTRDPLAHGPAWTYHRIVHTYPSLRIAKVWNAVRLLRFFLLSFIGGDISPFPDEAGVSGMQTLSGLKVYALDHMAGVAADVLATIPCFVHVDNHVRLFSAPARCLAWPLGIIEKSSICPVDAREYARKTLEWLAQDLNMPQAIHPDRQPGSREDWYAETHYSTHTFAVN